MKKHNEKKKIRLLASILLVVVILTLLGGCGKKGTSTAKLRGYDGFTFEETMSKFIEDVNGKSYLEIPYELTQNRYTYWYDEDGKFFVTGELKEGWIGEDAPDAALLTSSEKAMTYILYTEFGEGVNYNSARNVFYLRYSENSNLFIIEEESGGYLSDIFEYYTSEYNK